MATATRAVTSRAASTAKRQPHLCRRHRVCQNRHMNNTTSTQPTIGTPLRSRMGEFYSGTVKGNIVWVIECRGGGDYPDRVEVRGAAGEPSVSTTITEFEEVDADTLTYGQWHAGADVITSLSKSYLERAYAAANPTYNGQPDDAEAIEWLHRARDLRSLAHRLHVNGSHAGDAGRY